MIHIDFKSFLYKGLKYNDDYMVALILGSQGTGKTYLQIKLTEEFINKHPNYTIKTNIKSYYENVKNNRKIVYFEKLAEILNDFEDCCIYVIDELARKYPKNAPQDTLFLGWLMQSRKCHRYVIMTHQTYLLVPQWLREPIDHIYTTNNFIFKNLCITSYGTPILDEDTLDWCVQTEQTYIYKRNKKIANLYNTFEPVPNL